MALLEMMTWVFGMLVAMGAGFAAIVWMIKKAVD